MITESDLTLADGATLHVYDTGPGPSAADELAVLWHHGTPNIGAPPAPLFAESQRLGIRWIAYDRPGYGGSTPRPGRDVGSAATLAAATADALGVGRFATMGHSGGGPHALACAALLPDRVLAVLAAASLAPYDAPGLDYFAGMIPSGAASLQAALAGAQEKARHTVTSDYDAEFTPADLASLEGDWGWFGSVVGPAEASGPGGLIADDLAYVAPWGFDPAQVSAPVLLLHGDRDGVAPVGHAHWLAARCPNAELRVRPGDGHISVLEGAVDGLRWLREQVS